MTATVTYLKARGRDHIDPTAAVLQVAQAALDRHRAASFAASERDRATAKMCPNCWHDLPEPARRALLTALEELRTGPKPAPSRRQETTP